VVCPKPSDKGVALRQRSAYDPAILLRIAGSSRAEKIFRRFNAPNPPWHSGIQVNFCKNPECANYGIAAAQCTRGGAPRDRYAVVSAGRQYPVLECRACGEYPPLKSNQGIAEEHERLSAYLSVPPEASCPDAHCANHGVGVSAGSPHYRSYGTTRSGSKRYRGNACTKTFSVGFSTVGQKQPHKNRLIFQLLMNKSPFRRLCEIADIARGTLYPKIDFLHRQCLAFVGHRERHLLQGFSIPRLYIGVDRQDYIVNWTQREDKRNVQLTAVGSADNATRYVFGMHLNFDPDVEADVIEHEAATAGDPRAQRPFRRHARLWLASDYAAAQQRGMNTPSGHRRHAPWRRGSPLQGRSVPIRCRGLRGTWTNHAATEDRHAGPCRIHALRSLLPLARSEQGRGENPAVPRSGLRYARCSPGRLRQARG